MTPALALITPRPPLASFLPRSCPALASFLLRSCLVLTRLVLNSALGVTAEVASKLHALCEGLLHRRCRTLAELATLNDAEVKVSAHTRTPHAPALLPLPT